MHRIRLAPVFALLAALALTACGGTDEYPLDDDGAAPAVEQSEDAITAQPFCQTTTEEEREYEACGIDFPPGGEPHTIYRLCTRICSTRRELKFTVEGTECKVYPTICSTWQCGPCGG